MKLHLTPLLQMLFLTEQLMLSKGIRATTPVYFKRNEGKGKEWL